MRKKNPAGMSLLLLGLAGGAVWLATRKKKPAVAPEPSEPSEPAEPSKPSKKLKKPVSVEGPPNLFIAESAASFEQFAKELSAPFIWLEVDRELAPTMYRSATELASGQAEANPEFEFLIADAGLLRTTETGSDVEPGNHGYVTAVPTSSPPLRFDWGEFSGTAELARDLGLAVDFLKEDKQAVQDGGEQKELVTVGELEWIITTTITTIFDEQRTKWHVEDVNLDIRASGLASTRLEARDQAMEAIDQLVEQMDKEA